jgi:hypothetical protein
MYHNKKDTAHTKIDTTAQQIDLETPSKAPVSPPSKAFVHRFHNLRCSDLSPSSLHHINSVKHQEHECSQSSVLTPVQKHSQLLLVSLHDDLLSLIPDPILLLVRAFQQPPGCIPTTCPPGCTSPSTKPRHRHYSILESEILNLTHHIGSLHPSSPTIDITCVLNTVRSLQICVSEAIHNSEDDELMLVEETLLLALHVLRREKSYRRAPE